MMNINGVTSPMTMRIRLRVSRMTSRCHSITIALRLRRNPALAVSSGRAGVNMIAGRVAGRTDF
jgi:hypothetical protein